MSMIGNSLLFEIINSKKVTETNEILDLLNKMIIKSLRQEVTKNNDGMDVCLCRIERKENYTEINFTGAKRPLLYKAHNSKEIQKIRGDRKSIGGRTKKKQEFNYTKNKLILQKGSSIYLSSDGFADQNNKERQKFGSQKLISILEQISNENIETQHEILSNELDNWLKGTTQRDDITLVGIKI